MVTRFGRRILALAALIAATGISVTAGTLQKARRGKPALKVTPLEIARQKAFGVQTAPIRIDEFTDFQCPACRQLYFETLRPLINNEVSAGKVYLVHHDFPLNMHPYSHQAAYYADAAAAIGRFEQVEQALFTHQPEWEAKGDITPFLTTALTPAQLKQVEELSRTNEIHDAVQSDFDLGLRLKVNRTPTIFITYKGKRQPFVGLISYKLLQSYLNALLKQ